MKQKLIVLTGAGISAESGLKTFRDADGLWMGYDIYEVASPLGWKNNPGLVLDFYNQRRRDVVAATPNAAHFGLAELEVKYNVTIITQNIDDLHERAGSSNVIHLHGEIFQMCSEKNKREVKLVRGDINLGNLAEDGAQLRPNIVWFDEEVPMIVEAKKIMQTADIFLLIGTSLQVYPAAGLINYLPAGIPKYIIDKKIPYTHPGHNFTFIEKTATAGVGELIQLLR